MGPVAASGTRGSRRIRTGTNISCINSPDAPTNHFFSHPLQSNKKITDSTKCNGYVFFFFIATDFCSVSYLVF